MTNPCVLAEKMRLHVALFACEGGRLAKLAKNLLNLHSPHSKVHRSLNLPIRRPLLVNIHFYPSSLTCRNLACLQSCRGRRKKSIFRISTAGPLMSINSTINTYKCAGRKKSIFRKSIFRISK